MQLTGLFVDQGPVVQVRESGGRVSVNSDRQAGVAWDGPLAVLVNRASASASEIFAGAMQDYGRALIIGETTFGKGTVQNLVDLDRWPTTEGPRFGQVKLTIAQFFRIEGGSTQHKGVVPDIAYPLSVDANEFGESTYDNALPWTRIAAVPHARYGNFAPMLPRLQTLHAQRIAGDLNSSGGARTWPATARRRRRSTCRSTRPSAAPSVTARRPSASSGRRSAARRA